MACVDQRTPIADHSFAESEHNLPGLVHQDHRPGPWATRRSISNGEYHALFQGHVFLLHLDHLCIQFYQTVDRLLSSAIGGSHKVEAISYRHAGYVSQNLEGLTATDKSDSFHRHVHHRFDVRYYFSVHTCECWMGFHFAPTDRASLHYTLLQALLTPSQNCEVL